MTRHLALADRGSPAARRRRPRRARPGAPTARVPVASRRPSTSWPRTCAGTRSASSSRSACARSSRSAGASRRSCSRAGRCSGRSPRWGGSPSRRARWAATSSTTSRSARTRSRSSWVTSPGKGVGAALLMASLQATHPRRASAPSATSRGWWTPSTARSSSEEPLAPYYTLFLALLEGRTGRLRYVNAGHNTQFVLRRDGARRAALLDGRPPGLYPGGGYEERERRDAGRRRPLPVHRRPRRDRGRDGRALRHVAPRGAAQGPPGRADLPALLGHVDAAARAHRGAAGACRRRDHGRPPFREPGARGPAGEARPRRPRRPRVGPRGRRRGHLRGRRRLGRRPARPVGGPGRARGLRRRRVLEQPQDDPRRPALPAEARPAPPARVGARAGDAAAHRARAGAAAALRGADLRPRRRPGARPSPSASGSTTGSLATATGACPRASCIPGARTRLRRRGAASRARPRAARPRAAPPSGTTRRRRSTERLTARLRPRRRGRGRPPGQPRGSRLPACGSRGRVRGGRGARHARRGHGRGAGRAWS